MHLFVIYIGGIHKDALIELHDIRLIAAAAIEDTYDYLRSSWWGEAKSLHLDAYGILNYADGYDISLSNEAPELNEQKLYFVNLGGYDSKKFTELHENVFVVAEDQVKAKARALKLVQHWEVPHRDFLFEAEKIVEVSNLIKDQNWHLKLVKTDEAKKFAFTCKYIQIGS